MTVLETAAPRSAGLVGASHKAKPRLSFGFVVAGLAGVAFVFKLILAYTTLGTNDAITFYAFARSLSEHGLKWTYERGVAWLPNGPIFNHPPLTCWFLELIRYLAHTDVFQSAGLSFSFLLRLPGILADLVVIIAVLVAFGRQMQIPAFRAGAVLLAISPVSLMVSGYHGNTDPVMAMFLFLAASACLTGQAWVCGVLFALSCQIKIIPLLFLPIFVCFWFHRRALASFLLPLIALSIALWWEPLTSYPGLFVKNVLSYGSYWGLWGISYGLRSTGLPNFSSLLINLSSSQIAIATFLKILIVLTVAVIGWRRRAMDGVELIKSIAIGWIVFFVFSPGVCAQYLVWPAPFLLFLSPSFYAVVTAASSVFLFFFYNVISHGLPWYVGVSTNKLVGQWAPWGLLPWAALIIGTVILWKKRRPEIAP